MKECRKKCGIRVQNMPLGKKKIKGIAWGIRTSVHEITNPVSIPLHHRGFLAQSWYSAINKLLEVCWHGQADAPEQWEQGKGDRSRDAPVRTVKMHMPKSLLSFTLAWRHGCLEWEEHKMAEVDKIAMQKRQTFKPLCILVLDQSKEISIPMDSSWPLLGVFQPASKSVSQALP